MKAAGAVRELAEVVVRVVHERQPHALGAAAQSAGRASTPRQLLGITQRGACSNDNCFMWRDNEATVITRVSESKNAAAAHEAAYRYWVYGEAGKFPLPGGRMLFWPRHNGGEHEPILYAAQAQSDFDAVNRDEVRMRIPPVDDLLKSDYFPLTQLLDQTVQPISILVALRDLRADGEDRSQPPTTSCRR